MILGKWPEYERVSLVPERSTQVGHLFLRTVENWLSSSVRAVQLAASLRPTPTGCAKMRIGSAGGLEPTILFFNKFHILPRAAPKPQCGPASISPSYESQFYHVTAASRTLFGIQSRWLCSLCTRAKFVRASVFLTLGLGTGW